jgi:hypothetical protein
MAAPMPPPDVLWKQYELQVGLYKEYLNLLLRFNAFYYAATGAMVSYYFSKPEIPWMKYSLLFPVIMSIGFAGFLVFGANRSTFTRQELFQIRDALRLPTAPEYLVLTVLLWVSATLMFVVAIALLIIVIFQLPAPHNG